MTRRVEFERWLAASCILALLAGCYALTPPNCTIIRDIPCVGDEINVLVSGITTADVLAQLYSRFCGCVYIMGSLYIRLFDGPLTEDSFNSLYYLREISGILHFNYIPPVSSITLPNLRIIRGQITFSTPTRPASIIVENSFIGSLNLPNLTEITRGGAAFANTNGMCGFLNVNWADILNDGQLDSSLSGCTAPSKNCTLCPSQYCWSSTPLYCQTLTKTVCPQGCGRCFQPTVGGPYQCCHSLCAAGCSGLASSQCYACSILANNGTCVSQCPPSEIYDPALFMLVKNPNYRLAFGGLCVQQCPGNMLDYLGTCVASCPQNYTSFNGTKCAACSGPCPKVCQGAESGVTFSNIANFEGCTIVNGSLTISDSSFIRGTNLEILSTIQEIHGYLHIESVTMRSSFPYLRNVKIIGFPGYSNQLNISVTGKLCTPGYQLYSLFLKSTTLQSIDLSSLQLIQYGGYVQFDNSKLCYVGNFTRHLADRGSATCLSSTTPYRMNSSACIAAGLVCHSQCNSIYSCWGPNDTQCDGCRNFAYNGRCVQQCTDIVLPQGSSGIYQNDGTGVCEECDAQCLGGCTNGMDPYQCKSCRNFQVDTHSGKLCVATCPQGTYANGTSCTPCHHECTAGCVGPLPYLNLTNGCLECSYIEMDQHGQQVACHTSCLQGTYHASSIATSGIVPGNIQTLQAAVKDGTIFCLPCDDVCASCIGPGNMSCTSCRYARRYSQCVRECNNMTEFLDSASTCQVCAEGCVGCTGPSHEDCLYCADASCASSVIKSSGIAGIVFGGIGVILLVVTIVLLLFIAYRYMSPKNIPSGVKFDKTREAIALDPPKVPPNANRLLVTPETSLELGLVLGSGAFGTVYQGYWSPEGDLSKYEVAIKVLNAATATPQTQCELLQEGAIMAIMDHVNVVRLLCVCLGKQMMLVSEYAPLGSLLSYIKKVAIDAHSMISFSKQIADGMAYLEEKRMVHRDLAARNVLVHTPEVVKITDFGLTRIIDVGEGHYKATGGKVPLRWMAPESIFHFEYTHKSDVWSFGVTVWEILTCGRLPYEGKDGKIIVLMLMRGERLEKPFSCSNDLYDLLQKCWAHQQMERPNFSALSSHLKILMDNPSKYIHSASSSPSAYEKLEAYLTLSHNVAYDAYDPVPCLEEGHVKERKEV